MAQTEKPRGKLKMGYEIVILCEELDLPLAEGLRMELSDPELSTDRPVHIVVIDIEGGPMVGFHGTEPGLVVVLPPEVPWPDWPGIVAGLGQRVGPERLLLVNVKRDWVFAVDERIFVEPRDPIEAVALSGEGRVRRRLAMVIAEEGRTASEGQASSGDERHRAVGDWFRLFDQSVRRRQRKCTMTTLAPSTVSAGVGFDIQTIIHWADAPPSTVTGTQWVSTNAGAKIDTGTLLDIRLYLDGATPISPSFAQIRWMGEQISCPFHVRATAEDVIRGTVIVESNDCLLFWTRFEVPVAADTGAKALSVSNSLVSAFVSYAREDTASAARIVQGMKITGADVFFDQTSIPIGASFPEHLANEIRNRELFVLCWSHSSRQSGWVNAELRAAIESKRTIKVISLMGGEEKLSLPESVAHLQSRDALSLVVELEQLRAERSR